jgi:hypothetical protein
MLFHAYLKDGIVYVPTVVRLQIGGAYWDVEPVGVEPVANTEGLRRPSRLSVGGTPNFSWTS